MKITKRQLRRIIKEEKRKIQEGYPISPEVEALWGDVEGALDSLTTVLQKIQNVDPQAASDAAAYVAEEIHSWR